jgi:hypothetical protein
MNFGVISIEPLAEITVTFVLETWDDAGPVEARCAVIAFLRVGQIKFGGDLTVGDNGLGKITGIGGSEGKQRREKKDYDPHAAMIRHPMLRLSGTFNAPGRFY